jgi:hypothetical protein
VRGFHSKGGLALDDDIPVSVVDYDWNDHTMLVAVSDRLQLSFQVLTISQQIESIEFEGAEPADWTPDSEPYYRHG